MTSNIISDLISNIFSNNNNQGNSLISDYQKSLASQGYSPEVVNGVRQGLNGGNPEIQQWIEQYNQGAGRKTPINIPRTQEEIQLAKNNQFNNPTTPGLLHNGNIDLYNRPIVKNSDGSISTVRSLSFQDENGREVLIPTVSDDGKIFNDKEAIENYYKTGKHLGIFNNNENASAYAEKLHNEQEKFYTKEKNNKPIELGLSDKSSLLEKLADGISDFSTGFNENKNNAYLPSNLTDNKFSNGKEKNFMGRVGEAFGTGARAMNRPGVKGLATGLITTALTGNPMFGFTAGMNTAKASANSDVYAKALQEQGINVPTGIFNNYGASSMSSLMQPKYKEADFELRKLQQQILNEYRKAQVENQRYRNETDRNYKENRIINDTKKIANGGDDEVNKQAYQKDLSKLTDVLSNPKYSPEDKINAIKYIRQNHSKYFKASDIKDIEKLNELIGTQGNSDLKF